MKKLFYSCILLKLIFHVFCIAKEDCNIYSCSTTPPSTTKGQCFSAKKNSAGKSYNLTFKVCDSGYNCDSASSSILFIPGLSDNSTNCTIDSYALSSKRLRHPGEKCDSNNTCYGYCSNGTCKGKTSGGSCFDNVECDVGFYCNFKSQSCQTQVDIGGVCQYDNDCINTATCNNSTCVNYNSFADGAKITNCYACSSGMCYQDPITFEIICDTKILTSEQCGEGQDSCTYKYSSTGKIETGTCSCNLYAADQSRRCTPPEIMKETHYIGVHTDLRDGVPIQFLPKNSLEANFPICYGQSIFGRYTWENIKNGAIWLATNIKTIFGVILLVL